MEIYVGERRRVGELSVCKGRMTSQHYVAMLDDVLEPSNLKLFDDGTPNYLFQQDHAPCHRAQAAMHWFEETCAYASLAGTIF